MYMEIKLGTNFVLEPVNSKTEQVEKFKCKIVEQQGDALFIDYPVNIETKKTAFLLDGTQLRVSFQTETKDSYVFNTEVLGRRSGEIPMILLSCPPDEDFIKIQRREYVRVDTPVDIAIHYNDHFYQYVTSDISAGGIALKLNNRAVPFQEKDIVKLTIVLPFSNGEIQYVHTNATIVRIFEKDYLKIASIQFQDTADFDKQLIVRFCFERQLINRKKETDFNFSE